LRNQLLVKLGGETRYWRRQFLFDSPGWITIRKEIEPYIQLTTSLFNKEALEELMPSANSNYVQVVLKMKAFGLSNTSSLRIVLGLALWLKNHFNAFTIQQPLNQKMKKP